MGAGLTATTGAATVDVAIAGLETLIGVTGSLTDALTTGGAGVEEAGIGVEAVVGVAPFLSSAFATFVIFTLDEEAGYLSLIDGILAICSLVRVIFLISS